MKRLWNEPKPPEGPPRLKPLQEDPQTKVNKLTRKVVEHLKTGMIEKGWPISYTVRQPFTPSIVISIYSHHERLDRLYFNIGIHEYTNIQRLNCALKELENALSILPPPIFTPNWKPNVLDIRPIHPSDEDPNNTVGLFTDMARIKLTDWLYEQQRQWNWNMYTRVIVNPDSIWPTVRVTKITTQEGTTEQEFTITPGRTWRDIQDFQTKIAYPLWQEDNNKRYAESEAQRAFTFLDEISKINLLKNPIIVETTNQPIISVTGQNDTLLSNTASSPSNAKRRRKSVPCRHCNVGDNPVDLRSHNRK